MTAIGLGWRIHGPGAVVVALRGPAASPVVVLREVVTLVDDPSVEEPYHAAVGRPLDEARALIRSVEETAATAAASLLRGFASSLGPVAAVGVVGGNRSLPDLSRILAKHALLHAAERDLFEQAVVEGAARAGLPVTAVPATGKLFDDASQELGVELGPALAALAKTVGPPWKKEHREAAASALVALRRIDR